MKRISIRLASFALLVASAVFVLGACDSNGSGDGGGDVAAPGGDSGTDTVVEDSLQLVNVVPDNGDDLSSADTSFTFTFTDPVIENTYTDTTVEQSGGTRHLVDVIDFFPTTAKDLAPNGSIPFEISFNGDRTEMTIEPEQSLQNGFIYTINLGDPDQGTGLYSPRFKSEAGAPYAPNPSFPRDLEFTYSIGTTDTVPAAPTVTFQEGAIDDTGNLDYTQEGVTAELLIEEPTTDGTVKGYEVYYRSQNEAGRDGSGDEFRKAFNVTPEASPAGFDDAAGIIPVDATETVEDGALAFEVELAGYPLATGSPFFAGDGTYGPIEWKVRAVSVNNTRGDFTDVITTPDNDSLGLRNAEVPDGDIDDDDAPELVVTFDEPVADVDLSDFTVEDPRANEAAIELADVERVLNPKPWEIDRFVRSGLPRVVIELAGDGSNVEGDELTVDGVTDLAGNPIEVGAAGTENRDDDLRF